MAATCKMRWAQLSHISAGFCSSALPSTSSCSQFCLILHPHRVAVPFPPTFASQWGTALFESVAKSLCSKQNLGPPLTNDHEWPKNDQNWGVGSSGRAAAPGQFVKQNTFSSFFWVEPLGFSAPPKVARNNKNEFWCNFWKFSSWAGSTQILKKNWTNQK